MSTLAFEYRAVDKAGAKQRGTAHAANEVEAYRQVCALGLTPVAIRASRGGGVGGRKKRARAKDVAHLTSQIGVLVSARVPISDALSSIAEQEPDRELRIVIRDVAARIESGEPMADAMAAHSVVFGDVYIETVRAAEKTGTLTKVLDHLSDMLERSEETRRMVKGALMYPVIVLSVLLIGTTFLVGVVVPKFAKMFQERGVELPLLTQVLRAMGDSIHAYWYAYAVILAGIVGTVRWAWLDPKGRATIERWLHKVPYLRDILKGLALSRWAHVLSLGLSSGLGLIEALELSGRACGRPMLETDTRRLVDRVRTGGRLTEGMAGCEYITPFTKRMITAGETSGELSRMCSVVAKHYDRETQHLTKNIGTVIEPVMVVGIAGLVMVVALAIFLPMWNMVNLIK